jgi:hypothetical protein
MLSFGVDLKHLSKQKDRILNQWHRKQTTCCYHRGRRGAAMRHISQHNVQAGRQPDATTRKKWAN